MQEIAPGWARQHHSQRDPPFVLLFNMLSRFVIAFIPRSKCLLISWLQSLSAVILELKKIKSVPASTSSLYIRHEMMGPDATILVSLMLSFKPAFFHSPFSPSSLFHLVRVSSAPPPQGNLS